MYVTREEFDGARVIARRMVKNGPARHYRVVRGTLYEPTTVFEVVRMLELARYREARVCIHYGITESMVGPNPSHFVRPGGYTYYHNVAIGVVQQAPGRLKWPVIVSDTARDGEHIRDEQIVGIWPVDLRQGIGVLYRHSGYGPLPVE